MWRKHLCIIQCKTDVCLFLFWLRWINIFLGFAVFKLACIVFTPPLFCYFCHIANQVNLVCRCTLMRLHLPCRLVIQNKHYSSYLNSDYSPSNYSLTNLFCGSGYFVFSFFLGQTLDLSEWMSVAMCPFHFSQRCALAPADSKAVECVSGISMCACLLNFSSSFYWIGSCNGVCFLHTWKTFDSRFL